VPGLVPGIHVFIFHRLIQDVDGRVKPGRGAADNEVK